MNPKPLGLVERLLAERIGLDPSSVGDALIARGVQARMSALGLRSKAEYERILIESLDEFQALVEEVVVPESWFFRDERPFEVLGRFAREGWIGEPGRAPLSALSVPCASGEEPYSIAITILEAGLSSDRFRVDAVDVSARSLARAIAGVYGSNAFRGEASTRRSSYFRERTGAFTLDLAVRSTVRFHLGNLLDATLFADRGSFDVVFCRNLLIYLDDDANARALASLTRLVADGGLLFLGHADRLEILENSTFEPLAEKGAFAYRKGIKRLRNPKPVSLPPDSRRVGFALPMTPGRQGKPYPTSEEGRSSKSASSKVAGGAASPHPNPPPKGGRGPENRGRGPEKDGRTLASDSLPPCGGGLGWGGEDVAPPENSGTPRATGHATSPHPGASRQADSLLDQASALADSGQYNEAKALVDQAVADGFASARAYYLLGMLAQASGLRDLAEAHYLKAIYLDPQDDEALLALALLARRKGDVAAEAGYRRRAERVRSRKVIS